MSQESLAKDSLEDTIQNLIPEIPSSLPQNEAHNTRSRV